MLTEMSETDKLKSKILQETYDYYVRDNNLFGWDEIKKVCCYYGPDGCRCSIGRLVDVETAKEMQRLSDENGPSGLNLLYAAINNLLPDNLKTIDSFLGRLQHFHDYAAKTSAKDSFSQFLQKLAAEHGLSLIRIAHDSV